MGPSHLPLARFYGARGPSASGAAAGPASSSGARRPRPAPRALHRGLRERGGREAERAASGPRLPRFLPALAQWGRVAPRAAPGSPRGHPAGRLPSARSPPPPLARSPAAPAAVPFTLSAVYGPSPPPRPALGPGISSLFITYFDPASLCPRFLRKLYCPRSRVFD